MNDRVLLGFKGTMGEMELHVMAQRLQANKRAAAGRGELRTPLPVGYVHDDAGEVVIDPDAEVQAAVRDVFAAFCRVRVGLRRGRRVRCRGGVGGLGVWSCCDGGGRGGNRMDVPGVCGRPG